MKMFIAMLLISSNSLAYSSYNDNLECTEISKYGQHGDAVAISCVSKVSIEKDKAELKLIKLQIKKLEKEAKEQEEKK